MQKIVLSVVLVAGFAGVSFLDEEPPTKVLGDVIVQQAKPGPPSGGGGGGGQPGGGPPPGGGQAEFGIDGGITGLFPGASRGIALTISNPYAFAIKVTAVSARVKQSSNPACPLDSLVFDAMAGAVVVPARGTAAASLPVRMRAEAGNVCAGLTFTLSYSGEAVQA